MKKFLVILGALMIFSSNCLAMTFSQPIKIGGIGFPIQAPYNGYIVKGATKNSGQPYLEKSEWIETPTYTYKKGVAQWGNGINALFCDYTYSVPPSNSDAWKTAIKFGGKGNYIIATSSIYKDIYRIDSNEGLTIYSILQFSGSEQINIIGRQRNGKWVSYIDSSILTDRYFNGQQSYKASDGVHYDNPQVKNDTLIIPYKYQIQFKVVTKGEFRFKWDNKAQWFGIEQVVY